MKDRPKTLPIGLFLLAILYGGLACIAGVLGNKLVALGPLAVEAGIFAFILLVVISGAVAETYGRAIANRLVLFGLVPIIASMLLIQMVLQLPASELWEQERREAFDIILNQSTRLMLAGIIAYSISQLLNVYLFVRLRQWQAGFLWLRSIIAGVLSQAADTVIFITIAFYGVVPLLSILQGQLIAKILLSALLVPLLVPATVKFVHWLDSGRI